MAQQRYQGGCHCGVVRYEVSADLDHTITCNCSRCSKLGWILTFTPAGQFRLLSGEDKLTDYLFNKHAIHHLFCSVCGVESFARGKKEDGTEIIAVNARCLDDVDVASLAPKAVDGRRL